MISYFVDKILICKDTSILSERNKGIIKKHIPNFDFNKYRSREELSGILRGCMNREYKSAIKERGLAPGVKSTFHLSLNMELCNNQKLPCLP